MINNWMHNTDLNPWIVTHSTRPLNWRAPAAKNSEHYKRGNCVRVIICETKEPPGTRGQVPEIKTSTYCIAWISISLVCFQPRIEDEHENGGKVTVRIFIQRAINTLAFLITQVSSRVDVFPRSKRIEIGYGYEWRKDVPQFHLPWIF